MFRNRDLRNFLCALFLVSPLTLLAGGAHADPLRVGNILSRSGPALQVDITSMRALRYVDMVPQHTDFSCGAASLATILKYAYGRDVTEAEVVSGMFKVSDAAVVRREGFSLLDLKNYVETLGLRGRGYKIEPDVLDRIKIPVIVLLDIKGYKHFVVLKKVDGGRVYVGDPALGNRVLTRDDFLKSWNHIVFAVVGKGFIRDTVLVNPPEPFTARRLAGHHTITHAQLIDFGFTRADLF
jgi:predicted double-glycine peptidase